MKVLFYAAPCVRTWPQGGDEKRNKEACQQRRQHVALCERRTVTCQWHVSSVAPITHALTLTVTLTGCELLDMACCWPSTSQLAAAAACCVLSTSQCDHGRGPTLWCSAISHLSLHVLIMLADASLTVVLFFSFSSNATVSEVTDSNSTKVCHTCKNVQNLRLRFPP